MNGGTRERYLSRPGCGGVVEPVSESSLALGIGLLCAADHRVTVTGEPAATFGLSAPRKHGFPFPAMVEQVAYSMASGSPIYIPAGRLSLLADMSLSVFSWRYTIRRRVRNRHCAAAITDISQVNPSYFSGSPSVDVRFVPRGRAVAPILGLGRALGLAPAEPLYSELRRHARKGLTGSTVRML